jgi:acyl dehydratase
MRMTQAGEDSPRYFEDVAVGERTRTGSYTFERNSIVEFARLYDPQPMHLDEEAAKASFFGRLVASGWQTLGVTMRLMVEAKPLGTTPLIGLQIDDIRFTRPVLPGDTISAELEILEKRISKTAPSRGFVKGRTITSNQKGAEVSSQLWTMMVPLRNPGSAAG